MKVRNTEFRIFIVMEREEVSAILSPCGWAHGASAFREVRRFSSLVVFFYFKGDVMILRH